MSSIIHHPTTSPLFPYTTLFRSDRRHQLAVHRVELGAVCFVQGEEAAEDLVAALKRNGQELMGVFAQPDRKITRLNSSHLVISYAVFFLKKKRQINIKIETR